MVSVVIPAHNEEAVIGRLLSGLLAHAEPDEFEVIVVANGCHDRTARIARDSPGVRVLTTPVPSKFRAMRLGDQHATRFPRLYVDADVELGTRDARALAEALRRPGVLAAAPERTVTLSGRPLAVRWYYEFWERLPGVRDGLYGRGVIGVSAAGHHRLVAIPEVMGDDLAASMAFGPSEREVVAGARVVVHGPRTTGDLVKRRIRSLTATAQVDRARIRDRAADGGSPGSVRTGWSDLLRVVRREPRQLPRLPVFLGVTLISRLKARRPIRSGDFTTWLRDDSSRSDRSPDESRAASGGRQ